MNNEDKLNKVITENINYYITNMAVFAIYNLKYSSLSLFLIYSHRCPHGQLIFQNCVLALSRRSSNIQEEVPAHASMAVTCSCTFSSLSAQKKSDGKLTLPSLFLKKYEGEKMFSLLHHNTTYFVIC